MPHTKLVEHSTAMSRAVGDAYAALTNARAAGGLPATAMVHLGTLEGALSRVAERNAVMGEIGQGLKDDAPVEQSQGEAKDIGGGKGGKSAV